MSHRSHIEAIDRTLKDLKSINKLMGGITFVFAGDFRQINTIDTVTSTDDAIHYPQEFLNYLSPSGFPRHKIKFKIGAPITLLRNLQQPNLCNGTRLQIKTLRNNIIESVILTYRASKRINCIYSKNSL